MRRGHAHLPNGQKRKVSRPSQFSPDLVKLNGVLMRANQDDGPRVEGIRSEGG